MIAAVLRELMAAGLSGDALLAAVERIEAAEAVEFRGIPVDVSAEKRRAYDRERKRAKKHSGGIPVEIPRNSNVVLYSKNNTTSLEKESRGRGSRIPPEYEPDLEVGLSMGMSRKRAETQALKFKNYWMAKSGRDATKVDWDKTWENWVISDLEKYPPDAKPEDRVDRGGFYAALDSPQLEAWDQYCLKTKGKRYPRDRNGGWRFPTEWPPESQARAQ
jgi:hypothetical protein